MIVILITRFILISRVGKFVKKFIIDYWFIIGNAKPHQLSIIQLPYENLKVTKLIFSKLQIDMLCACSVKIVIKLEEFEINMLELNLTEFLINRGEFPLIIFF